MGFKNHKKCVFTCCEFNVVWENSSYHPLSSFFPYSACIAIMVGDYGYRNNSVAGVSYYEMRLGSKAMEHTLPGLLLHRMYSDAVVSCDLHV